MKLRRLWHLAYAPLALTNPGLASAQEGPPSSPAPSESPPPEAAPDETSSAQAPEPAPPPPSDASSSESETPPPTPASAEPPPSEEPLPPPGVAPPEAEPPVEIFSEEIFSGEPHEVTVVGTSWQRTAGSAHIIWDEQLQRFEKDDAHAVLATVPGVYARGEDGLGLRPNIGIRGVNPDRSKKVTLMEDGVLFGPAPYSASAAYYFPLMTRMAQVKVIKGPGSVSYGPSTIGGAIDFVTRPIPSQATAYLDVGGGMYGYFKTHAYAGASTDQMGFLVEGVHLQSSGFKHLPTPADTGFAKNEVMTKAEYHFKPVAGIQNKLSAKFTYSDELSNETYLGLAEADFREDPLQRYGASALDQMRNDRSSFVLTHHMDLTPELRVTTDLYRHAFYRVWRKLNGFRGANLFSVLRHPESGTNPAYVSILRGESDTESPVALLIGPNQRDFLSQGVQSRFEWELLTGPVKHHVEYGFRVHHDRIHRRHSEDAFVTVGGELFPEGGSTTVTTLNQASTLAFALFAADAITWKDLTLTPGIRVEAFQQSFEDSLLGRASSNLAHALVPGVGAFYGLTESFGVLAGIYRGFNPPPPTLSGSPQPEQSVNYEAGARFVQKRLRVEAISFYSDYQNLADICTTSSSCEESMNGQQFDAGPSRTYGLEAFADYTHELRHFALPMTLSYTLTRGEFLRSFSSDNPLFGTVESGDELTYIPTHQLTAVLGAEHERVGLNASFRYVSPMREEPGTEPYEDSLVTDEQAYVDLAAYVKLTSWLELYGNVDNVLDNTPIVGRRPFGARPAAPRWVRFGLKATY